MSHYNFEGQPEGDWDDRGDLSWSELDWNQFLRRQETEVAKFLHFYDQSPVAGTERLDWVARQMGWDSEDWSVGDFFDEDEDFGEEWKTSSRGGESNEDPYTLHRHPVFIVTTGLFAQVRHVWRCIIESRKEVIDPLVSWDFSESLIESERQFLLGLQSMDVGDYLLCIVHLKRAMRGLNLAMKILPMLAPSAPIPEHFRRNTLARLFDLREVALRVIIDCRDEENRDFRDLD